MKWFSPSTVTNSTVLPKIFSALNSWMLSPIGTLVSAVPCNNNKGVLILSALNSDVKAEIEKKQDAENQKTGVFNFIRQI